VSGDLDLLVEAAREAGEIALKRRAAGLTVTYKPGDATPVSDADLAVDAFLAERLLPARPGYGWLSEETTDDPVRLECSRIFLVDPIDGTRAYVKGRPWFCVSIAVVEDGRPIVGVVHAPELGETFTAELGGGAYRNGAPIAPSLADAVEGARMLGDAPMFSHPAWPIPWPAMTIETRNSIAYRLCLVADGRFDAALAPAGKSDWDLAAADLIVNEAGGFVSDVRGRPFRFNGPSARQHGVVCAAPGLAPLILERLKPIEWPAPTA